jgi:hypothetical protein
MQSAFAQLKTAGETGCLGLIFYQISLNSNAAVEEHARPGLGWTRLAASLSMRNHTICVRPNFLRGRGKLHLGRVRSLKYPKNLAGFCGSDIVRAW